MTGALARAIISFLEYTNGQGVFGFTPEDIYIEHNMKYIASTVPLTFGKPVQLLAILDTDQAKKLLAASKAAMAK